MESSFTATLVPESRLRTLDAELASMEAVLTRCDTATPTVYRASRSFA